MFKDTSYKEKFTLLRNWMPAILTSIKSDLRKDHLQQDWMFVKKYFANNNLHKLSTDDLFNGYSKAIDEEEKAEQIAEFIFHRWLIKHTEIYCFFEEELKKIDPNFTQLNELDATISHKLMDAAIKQHGAQNAYLFAVINSVVFPKSVYEAFRNAAEQEAKVLNKQAADKEDQQKVELTQIQYQQELARLKDKYEKKLAGLQKKYLVDTEALKKQVAALQRKLNGS